MIESDRTPAEKLEIRTARACPGCGQPISPTRFGRPRTWCSPACARRTRRRFDRELVARLVDRGAKVSRFPPIALEPLAAAADDARARLVRELDPPTLEDVARATGITLEPKYLTDDDDTEER